MSQSATPQSSEHEKADASTATNTVDDSSDEELQNTQILAHAKSVATPPPTPSLTEWIEMDITSNDIREHSPRLYLARHETRPPCLTEEEIAGVIRRLEIDLDSGFGKIRAKTLRKPWAESMLIIKMRMSGILKRGSTRVRLSPCIWFVCGSKWCQKIIQNDVKCLGWLSPYDIQFVHKGGPLLSAGEQKGKGPDVSESLVSLSFSDYHDCAPRGDTSITYYSGNRSDVSAYDDAYSWGSQSVYPPAQFSPASGVATSYGSPYQTNTATSSAGAYGYPNASASDSDYAADYAKYEYDTVSIASSSAPSYTRRSGPWTETPSVGTTATSAPSTRTDVDNTIHRQAPPNERYQLPCEFSNLTGCSRTFHGDEEQDWIDHHVNKHLRDKLPSKLRCCK